MNVNVYDVQDFFRQMYEAKAISYTENQRIMAKLQPHSRTTDVYEVLCDIARYKRAQIITKE